MDRPEAAAPIVHRAGAARWVIGILLVIAVAWFGRYLGHHLVALENWVRGLGPAGPLVFLAAFTILALFCLPDSLFAVTAGVLFGLWLGTALITVGSLAATSLSFVLARRLLHEPVERHLEHSPRLLAIKRAVGGAGLRLQVLLRLTPLNPVLVSYIMGTTGIRYAPFLVACFALIPGFFVEVYLGYTAAHLSKVTSGVQHHPPWHTALAVTGLVMCIVVMAVITRAARRALADQSSKTLEQ